MTIVISLWTAVFLLWMLEETLSSALTRHDQERAEAERKRIIAERKRIESSPEYIAREHARNLARGRRTIDDLFRDARNSRR